MLDDELEIISESMGSQETDRDIYEFRDNFEDQELEEKTQYMNMIYCHSLVQGVPQVFYKY